MSDRKNEERLPTVPTIAQPSSDSSKQSLSLSFPTPTEFVDLPSEGKYYPTTHPLYGKDSIEIRYMTAADEDILNSKSLLKKGVALERFLQNIIVDQSIKIDDLLICDKNALIIGSRITGYGEEYSTTFKCPNCDKSNENVFHLDSSLTINKGNLEEITSDNTFFVTLPITKLPVECRLLYGRDEKSIAFIKEANKKNNLSDTDITDQLRLIIVSVNGIKDDRAAINGFIKLMPARDSKYLREKYEELTPNIKMREEVICKVCEEEHQIDIPLTSDFFWPKR